MDEQKSFKTGLVLSGGGAWGYAHLGLLQAMEEYKIVPDIISGTSMGALIGALYADGYSAQEIIEIAESINFLHFAGIYLPTRGLLEMKWPEKLLTTVLRVDTFEKLRTPLVVTAVNLSKGEVVHFRSGTIIDKIIASASVPILFKPVVIDGDDYVDGGLLDNFPVATIRDECEKIIGMNVQPKSKHVKTKNLIQIAEQSFFLSLRTQGTTKAELCDVYMEPKEINATMFNVVSAKKIAVYGYDVARRALDGFLLS